MPIFADGVGGWDIKRAETKVHLFHFSDYGCLTFQSNYFEEPD